MNVVRAARQSPAMVLAALALIFAMVGTAIAGPDAISRAITKSKVKSISKKQATKIFDSKIGSASVANAINAINATNATNATNLNNEGASVYLNRVAQNYDASTPLPASTNTEIVAPASITVPAGVNFIRVYGETTMSATGATTYTIWLQQDGACAASGVLYVRRPFGSLDGSADQNVLTYEVVLPATPGDHTYRLCAFISGLSGNATNATVIAETIPRGATGGTTGVAASTRAVSDSDGDPSTPE